MKNIFLRVLLFSFFQFLSNLCSAQASIGTWKGIAKQDQTIYTYTIKIDRVKKDSVFGITISSTANFYSETRFKGIINGNLFTILEHALIKTNYKGSGTVCLMKLNLKRTNDQLMGSFTSSNKESKDCGSGTLLLELVKEKKKIPNTKKDTLNKQPPAYEKPQPKVAENKQQDEEKKEVAKVQEPEKNESTRKPEQRDIELLNTFRFKEDSVMIKVYDNGIIDGDVITLIINNRIVFDKIKLTAKPLSYALMAKNANNFQIEFFAETLGEIPPNTGLITISSATKTSEVLFSSDLKKSAAIKIILKDIP